MPTEDDILTGGLVSGDPASLLTNGLSGVGGGSAPDPDPDPPASGSFGASLDMGHGLVTDTQRLTAGDGPVRLYYVADQPLTEGAAAKLYLRKAGTVTTVTGVVLFGPTGLVTAVVETIPPAGDYLLSWEVAGVHYPLGFPIRVSIAVQLEAV